MVTGPGGVALHLSDNIQWEPVLDPFGVPYLDQNKIWPLELTHKSLYRPLGFDTPSVVPSASKM